MTSTRSGENSGPSNPESSLSERLERVHSAVDEAARVAGRSADNIVIVVVTKFHPTSLIRELESLGVRDIGESRHQEARVKAQDAADLDLNWHFVGQVQRKKMRQIASYAHVIHSIDREPLLDSLSTSEHTIDCYLQLNLTSDTSRGGVQPDSLRTLAEHALTAPGVRLRGVMAVAPLGEEPRAAFARVRKSSELLQTIAPEATEISMGMSGDFPEAVLEGATHLRIGTAITGNRPPAG